MVKITLVRRAHVHWDGTTVPATTIVREFDDHYVAANWFIEDSYFDEDYTTSATWECIQ